MNITKALKLCVCLLVSLSVILSFLGYAVLTDDLAVSGTVKVREIKGLYICDYHYASQYNDNVTVTGHIGTVLNSTVSLKESNGTTNSVTHTVTVYNNTESTYYFDDVTYIQNHYDNQNITFSYEVTDCENPNDQLKRISPGGYMDISVTFTFKNGASQSNAVLNSSLSYNFLLEKESIEEAIIDVIEKFRLILNDEADIGYLMTHIDDKFDGTGWKANFIGNVAGSSLEDTAHMTYLFEAHLNLIIDGKETPITLLIKMEDVDGNVNTGCMYHSTYTNAAGQVLETSGKGCEMSLYITTNKLDNNSQPASPIYAVVFSCQTTYTTDSQGNILSAKYGQWIQLGDKRNNNGMYVGKAEVVGYVGNTTVNGTYISTGSFNTGDWKLTSEHAITDSVKVSSGATIQTVISKYLSAYGFHTIKADGTIV